MSPKHFSILHLYLLLVCNFTFQHDDGKLEDLLKIVASTDVPVDAPLAPPPTDEEMELTDAEMLPSQREKCKNMSFWIPEY